MAATEQAKHVIPALEAVADYLRRFADVVDGDYGVPEPNEAMRLLSEVEDAISASSDPWRSIATAPRDGTRVMVFPDNRFGGHGWTVAKWESGCFGGLPRGSRHLTGWISDGGFFMGPQPTHWMPLPAPPIAAEKLDPSARCARCGHRHIEHDKEPIGYTCPDREGVFAAVAKAGA